MWKVGDIIYRATPTLVELFKIINIKPGDMYLYPSKYEITLENCLNGTPDYIYSNELKDGQDGLMFYSTDINKAFDWVRKFEGVLAKNKPI